MIAYIWIAIGFIVGYTALVFGSFALLHWIKGWKMFGRKS